MNSKIAVNSVLNHQQPDYIPLGTYAVDCDTVEKILGHESYVRDKIKTQIALWEGRRDEVVQSLKEDSVELFKKLDCIDVIIPFKEARLLPPKGYEPERVTKVDDNTWESENGTVYRCSYLTNDITVVNEPFEYRVEELSRDPVYQAPDDSIFEAFDYLVDNFKENRFLLGISGGFHPMVLPGGMEKGLMDYYLNPDLIRSVIRYDVKLQNYLDQYYIRGGVDAILIENDFATSLAPLMSPEMFSDFCLPAMKERINAIKRFRDNVFLHSCGNTRKIMDMIIEAGVDCYQSLQTGIGMDIQSLKREFGIRMCFWGGISVEKLIGGTPEEVREDIRKVIFQNASDGGFILGPSHSVAYGVKYENFMDMLDEHSKLKYIC